MKKLIFALTVLTFIAAAPAYATWAPDATRSITWQDNVGVSGDIPTRLTNYTTLHSTGGDDTTKIQTAINNCPSTKVVALAAGVFNVTKLDMKSNITLRGAGLGVTVLHGTTGGGASYEVSLGSYNNYGTAYGISSGYTKGSTAIVMASSPGWSVGDIICIDQTNTGASADPPINNVGAEGTNSWDTRSSGTRGLNQLVRVSSVSGTNIGLDIPMYYTLSSGQTPQAVKVTMSVTGAGIENLTIDSTSLYNVNQSDLTGYSTVKMLGSNGNWLLQCEVKGIWGEGALMQTSYRNTIRSCVFHDPHQFTTSAGYAVYMNYGASANLIENCQVYHLPTGIIMQNGSGNVIAGNYCTNLSIDGQNATWGISTNHGVHPYMNLVEGNYLEGCYLTADWIHGTSSHNTWFRNRVTIHSASSASYNGELVDACVWTKQTYYSMVGNVFGSSGFENYLSYVGIPFSAYIKSIYCFGATASNGSGTSGTETSTLFRHGNYDYYQNAVTWDSGTGDHVLPASLYLSAKPSWWPAGTVWPSIDPLSPSTASIPARDSYLGVVSYGPTTTPPRKNHNAFIRR